ncbi:hypothetical protein RJ641_035771 [Dillenia turbinata]|uniref:Uncharacterized protein n=1 Tax=Dillenia turbinata TaxID=194707 RepID=A0AAN8VT81_9MAGN
MSPLLVELKCSSEINKFINGYNSKIKDVLQHLNQNLGPEVIFMYANSYDIFVQIILNYYQYNIFFNAVENNYSVLSIINSGTGKFECWQDLKMQKLHVVVDTFYHLFASGAVTQTQAQFVCSDGSKYVFGMHIIPLKLLISSSARNC